jgi:hypothetical protein
LIIVEALSVFLSTEFNRHSLRRAISEVLIHFQYKKHKFLNLLEKKICAEIFQLCKNQIKAKTNSLPFSLLQSAKPSIIN